MTNLEFFIARRKAELPAFIRVLKAIPEKKSDYRPDPKARRAVDLAWLLAVEEIALLSLIDTGAVEWKDTPPPEHLGEIVAEFDRSSAEVNARLEGLDGAAWEGPSSGCAESGRLLFLRALADVRRTAAL